MLLALLKTIYTEWKAVLSILLICQLLDYFPYREPPEVLPEIKAHLTDDYRIGLFDINSSKPLFRFAIRFNLFSYNVSRFNPNTSEVVSRYSIYILSNNPTYFDYTNYYLFPNPPPFYS